MKHFQEGQEVKSIWWNDESFISVESEHVINGCDKITVVMEYGYMAGVPWFAVWENGKIVSKHNSVHISSVVLKNG